jgi:hypothetical protein
VNATHPHTPGTDASRRFEVNSAGLVADRLALLESKDTIILFDPNLTAPLGDFSRRMFRAKTPWHYLVGGSPSMGR